MLARAEIPGEPGKEEEYQVGGKHDESDSSA